MLCSSHVAYAPPSPSAVRPGELAQRSSSFNAALRSSARLRQNAQTRVANRGVLCSSHVDLRAPAALHSAPGELARRSSSLQCGAQEFSQTEAKLADPDLQAEACCARVMLTYAPPAALHGAPGELARRSSSFNAALRSSARLRQNSQTRFASRGVLCSSHVGLRAPPPSTVRQGTAKCGAAAASMRRSGVQPD